jgi:hypothetical protein
VSQILPHNTQNPAPIFNTSNTDTNTGYLFFYATGSPLSLALVAAVVIAAAARIAILLLAAVVVVIVVLGGGLCTLDPALDAKLKLVMVNEVFHG